MELVGVAFLVIGVFGVVKGSARYREMLRRHEGTAMEAVRIVLSLALIVFALRVLASA